MLSSFKTPVLVGLLQVEVVFLLLAFPPGRQSTVSPYFVLNCFFSSGFECALSFSCPVLLTCTRTEMRERSSRAPAEGTTTRTAQKVFGFKRQ